MKLLELLVHIITLGIYSKAIHILQ